MLYPISTEQESNFYLSPTKEAIGLDELLHAWIFS